METLTGTPVRRLSPQTIKARLKKAGYNQRDVARLANTSPTAVTDAIFRMRRNTPASEAVWKTLEKLLA